MAVVVAVFTATLKTTRVAVQQQLGLSIQRQAVQFLHELFHQLIQVMFNANL